MSNIQQGKIKMKQPNRQKYRVKQDIDTSIKTIQEEDHNRLCDLKAGAGKRAERHAPEAAYLRLSG